TAHLYLWCPNALLPDGLAVMKAWGFAYKANIVWHKIRKDGGSDGRGVGFCFRNVTELVLFGIRGKNARTLAPGRRQLNFRSLRRARRHRTSNCSLAANAKGGRPGGIKPAMAMRPTKIAICVSRSRAKIKSTRWICLKDPRSARWASTKQVAL